MLLLVKPSLFPFPYLLICIGSTAQGLVAVSKRYCPRQRRCPFSASHLIYKHKGSFVFVVLLFSFSAGNIFVTNYHDGYTVDELQVTLFFSLPAYNSMFYILRFTCAGAPACGHRCRWKHSKGGTSKHRRCRSSLCTSWRQYWA